MIGTAEDHHSNPLRIAIAGFKRGGGRFVSISQVRTGCSAIADSGSRSNGNRRRARHGAAAELIASDLIDHAFLKRYTNAPQLVVLDPGARVFAHVPTGQGAARDGREPHNKLVFDRTSATIMAASPQGIGDGCDPALEGRYRLGDGTNVAPSFQLLRDRVLPCTPEWASAITGIAPERIR
jgi:anaerobic selenocysteine-containing dehydrogenase